MLATVLTAALVRDPNAVDTNQRGCGMHCRKCLRTHKDDSLKQLVTTAESLQAQLLHHGGSSTLNQTISTQPDLIWLMMEQYGSTNSPWHAHGIFDPPLNDELSHCPLDVLQIARNENSTYSQYGEDGVLAYLCSIVGCPKQTYVEFGAQDCSVCNSRALRARGWTGLVMDGSEENLHINLRREIITVQNIVPLLHKYGVESELDVLVVDIDGADFYVLRKILCSRDFRPRIIVVEYQERIPSVAGAWVTPLGEPPSRCTGFCNGMSVGAVRELGARHGYELVYTMTMGVDAFLVRRDVLPSMFAPPPLSLLDRAWTRKYHPWPHTANLKSVHSALRWLYAQPRWDDLRTESSSRLLDSCDEPSVAPQDQIPVTPRAYGSVADKRTYGR